MRLRGIPGCADNARAAHALAARSKRTAAPRPLPAKLDDAAAESLESEAGPLPGIARKGS